MKVRDLIKKIEAAGWSFDHQKGSHRVYKKDGVAANISVPGHDRNEVKPGILASSLKKAGLKP